MIQIEQLSLDTPWYDRAWFSFEVYLDLCVEGHELARDAPTPQTILTHMANDCWFMLHILTDVAHVPADLRVEYVKKFKRVRRQETTPEQVRELLTQLIQIYQNFPSSN